MTPSLDLWLASTSPRRRELLERAGIRFGLCEPGPEYGPGEAGEHQSTSGDPAAHALERARRKALGAKVPDAAVAVLGVDTVVDLDGTELGKPRDRDDAERMLRLLSGRRHRVHTAHCLSLRSRDHVATALASAVVACRSPSAAELEHYLASGQWCGKAGGYGIQDEAQRFFSLVEGSFDTVVGLHVPSVLALLADLRGTS
ncbi:MAG TPA: Maf family protein [Planctomycetota bacterium]|nr:Maf family protein [Planctomycetota bacterium]